MSQGDLRTVNATICKVNTNVGVRLLDPDINTDSYIVCRRILIMGIQPPVHSRTLSGSVPSVLSLRHTVGASVSYKPTPHKRIIALESGLQVNLNILCQGQ